MTKRVFLIHGWGGSPDEAWRPWLKEELEKHGFAVFNLAMPNADNPKQSEWVNHLKNTVATPDEDCYFIGHSLGSIAILRYLEALAEGSRIGGAIFVAGFSHDIGIKDLLDFFKESVNWVKIKKHCKNFVAIHSDNDYYIPQSHGDIFKEKLDAEVIVLPGMKHFSGDDGTTELPIVLEKLLQIAGR